MPRFYHRPRATAADEISVVDGAALERLTQANDRSLADAEAEKQGRQTNGAGSTR